jgi:hypothetical protein
MDFGVAIRNLYGLAHITNSVCNENEGHGIVMSSTYSHKP